MSLEVNSRERLAGTAEGDVVNPMCYDCKFNIGVRGVVRNMKAADKFEVPDPQRASLAAVTMLRCGLQPECPNNFDGVPPKAVEKYVDFPVTD